MKVIVVLACIFIASPIIYHGKANADAMDDYYTCMDAEKPPDQRIDACKLVLQDDFLDDQGRSFSHHNIAQGYNARHDYANAVEHFTASIELNPHWSASYIGRGLIYLTIGQPGLSVLDFSEAIRINGPQVSTLTLRATAHTALQHFEEAMDDFNQVLKLDPNKSDHYANRSSARFLLGDFQGAESDARRAIEIDASNVSAHRSLATFLSLAPENFQDAKSAVLHAEKAVSIQETPGHVGLLAVALMVAGRVEEGLDRFATVFQMSANVGARYQSYLKQKKYYDGPVNGKFDTATIEAIRECFTRKCRFMVD